MVLQVQAFSDQNFIKFELVLQDRALKDQNFMKFEWRSSVGALW